MPPTPTGIKKGLKIKLALKSAARLPARVSNGRGSGRNNLSPIPGELPIVLLKIQIIGCTDLLAKDRNGFSDPFVVVSVLNTRHQTPVNKRTINPVYQAKDATFEFPLYLSLADKLGAIEVVVWDKDMLSKDYLGEAAIPLENWFTDKDGNARPFSFDDRENKSFSLNVLSTRANTQATGAIQLKLGFATPPNVQNLLDYDEIFSEFQKRSRPSLVSAPPTEGVGTLRSHQDGAEYEDDGGLSSDEGSDDDDFAEGDQGDLPSPLMSSIPVSPTETITPALPQESPRPLTPSLTPTPPSSAKTNSKSGFIPKMIFPRRLSGLTSSTPATTDDLPASPTGGRSASPNVPEKEKKKIFRKSWNTGSASSESTKLAPGNNSPNSGNSSGSDIAIKKRSQYSLDSDHDIVGIVMLEIQRAQDLPRLANMTRTGWDMDPFVVISFGKKVFRTRVIRHSRNPIWDEKLLFHVRRYETTFKVQLTILDWDKLSSNDHVGDASFDLKELLDGAPQRDPVTGLYPADNNAEHPMSDFQLRLSTGKDMAWEARHNPTIIFRAKYQPYDALRQRFWRQYLKQYDTDDTGLLSHLELTSMLDSLGSTLTRSTVNSFFTRNGKEPHKDDLTINEIIQSLETELGRPASEKRRLDSEDAAPDSSVSATPVLMVSGPQGQELALDQLSFSGPPVVAEPDHLSGKPGVPSGPETEGSQHPLLSGGLEDRQAYSSSDDAEEYFTAITPESSTAVESEGTTGGKKKKLRFRKNKTPVKQQSTSSSPGSEESLERVINVKNCPLCHRQRLNSKSEVDIITHLAVCASQDWNKVDRIVVGNFVTASQAQRKWYTKVISKVSSGDYKLGANSANIIVQNRMTGQLEEEKMQVYVRLGIRLLYKGATSRMEGARARRLLKSLSIKQGVKYDAPESARDIPTFIEFHHLKVDEILDPLDSFKNFNQFFYRKLKASARPVERPEDPYRLVSAADCRLMTFHTVSEATNLWIKGREFTVARLLGDAYKDQADRYIGGALAIFRLAPQDYHRFHSPVDGTIGPMTYIAGEYYTVNPQAIRTSLDVYGENARKIVPIDSPQFGRVMAVCIGAMMVGSIKTTVKEGDKISRGQEFGYFAFGGSTIVILLEKGVVQWDEDLLINGRASLETLVRVGTGIGTGRRGNMTPA